MMDISKTYIKMSNCKEIQKQWKPSIGDYLLEKYTVFGEELDKKLWKNKSQREEIQILHYKSIGDFFHSCTINGEQRTVNFQDTDSMIKVTSIWLPRQDQLQAMMELPNNFKIFHPIAVNSKYRIMWGCNFVDGDSMEQLWLSFVMSEKYSKQWNSEKEEWIK